MVGPNFYLRKNLVKKGLIYEITAGELRGERVS
jgi:hypothetical protein